MIEPKVRPRAARHARHARRYAGLRGRPPADDICAGKPGPPPPCQDRASPCRRVFRHDGEPSGRLRPVDPFPHLRPDDMGVHRASPGVAGAGLDAEGAGHGRTRIRARRRAHAVGAAATRRRADDRGLRPGARATRDDRGISRAGSGAGRPRPRHVRRGADPLRPLRVLPDRGSPCGGRAPMPEPSWATISPPGRIIGFERACLEFADHWVPRSSQRLRLMFA